jgi:hypothetical protein
MCFTLLRNVETYTHNMPFASNAAFSLNIFLSCHRGHSYDDRRTAWTVRVPRCLKKLDTLVNSMFYPYTCMLCFGLGSWKQLLLHSPFLSVQLRIWRRFLHLFLHSKKYSTAICFKLLHSKDSSLGMNQEYISTRPYIIYIMHGHFLSVFCNKL